MHNNWYFCYTLNDHEGLWMNTQLQTTSGVSTFTPLFGWADPLSPRDEFPVAREDDKRGIN